MSVRAKKALVLGGAGFLGSHLCERLLAEGYAVTAVDNLLTGSVENLAAAGRERSAPPLTFIEADVCDLKAGDFAGKFDEIYSFACPASPIHYQQKSIETTKTSIFGIYLAIDLAMRDSAKLLHASTSEVYGDPLVHPQEEHYWGNVNTIGARSCYDEGKRVAETILADHVRVHGVDARMVRIFNTYGPRMHHCDGRVVSNFIMQALCGEDVTIYGDGDQTRSFMYCDDLVEAVRRLMAKDAGEVREFAASHALGACVLNVGNPGEFTINELAAKVLAKIPSSPSRIVRKPLPADDPKKRRPDITLAKEFLGWKPATALDAGLDKTIEYFRNRFGAQPSVRS